MQPWRIDGVRIMVGIFEKPDKTRFSAFVQLDEDDSVSTLLTAAPSVLYREVLVWCHIAEEMAKANTPLRSQPPANMRIAPTSKE